MPTVASNPVAPPSEPLSRSVVPFLPGAAFDGLSTTLGKRLPDLSRKVSGLTRGEDVLQSLQHRCWWCQTERGHVPQLIELQSEDRHIGRDWRLVDDVLSLVVGASRRSFASKPCRSLIGRWFLFVVRLLFAATWVRSPFRR